MDPLGLDTPSLRSVLLDRRYMGKLNDPTLHAREKTSQRPKQGKSTSRRVRLLNLLTTVFVLISIWICLDFYSPPGRG